MLKRQRPQSPPLSSGSSVPLVSELVDDFPAAPTFKRRRTAPPLLDGVSRGWSQTDEEDGDYELSDDDDTGAAASQDGTPGEYRATNSLLRELHALHQHRLLFSPLSEKSHHLEHRYPHNQLPPPIPHVYASPMSKVQCHSTVDATQVGANVHHPVGEEITNVMKRYEGTNRLIGQLFLSRRRELGGTADNSDPS